MAIPACPLGAWATLCKRPARPGPRTLAAKGVCGAAETTASANSWGVHRRRAAAPAGAPMSQQPACQRRSAAAGLPPTPGAGITLGRAGPRGVDQVLDTYGTRSARRAAGGLMGSTPAPRPLGAGRSRGPRASGGRRPRRPPTCPAGVSRLLCRRCPAAPRRACCTFDPFPSPCQGQGGGKGGARWSKIGMTCFESLSANAFKCLDVNISPCQPRAAAVCPRGGAHLWYDRAGGPQ